MTGLIVVTLILVTAEVNTIEVFPVYDTVGILVVKFVEFPMVLLLPYDVELFTIVALFDTEIVEFVIPVPFFRTPPIK